MKHCKALLLLFALLAYSAWAGDTKYLIVDGGIDAKSNAKRYYNSSFYGYESAKTMNKDVKVYAKDGKWNLNVDDGSYCTDCGRTTDGMKKAPTDESKIPGYPPVDGSMKSVADLKKAIQSMNLKTGDSLVLNLTGHGGSTSSDAYTSSGEATYCLWGKCVPYSDLKEALKAAPSGAKIKLVVSSCYAGGAQALARDLPNVCATTSVPQFTVSKSGDNPQFERGFYDKISSKPHPGGRPMSFGEASLAAIKNDKTNSSLGTISSFDYVNYVLKSGAYTNKFKNDKSNGDELVKPEGYNPVAMDTDALGFRDWSVPGNGFIHPDLSGTNTTRDQCFDPKFLGNALEDVGRIKYLTDTLNDITSSALTYERSKDASSSPDWQKSVFQEALDYVKQGDANFEAYRAQLASLSSRWNAHVKKYSDASSLTKWWDGEEDERASMQAEYDKIRSNMNDDPALAKYNYYNHILDQLDKLSTFKDKATPEQKAKFLSLLKCESEPI